VGRLVENEFDATTRPKKVCRSKIHVTEVVEVLAVLTVVKLAIRPKILFVEI
jgi:hypothetical protein